MGHIGRRPRNRQWGWAENTSARQWECDTAG